MNKPYEVEVFTFNRWVSDTTFSTKEEAIKQVNLYLHPARVMFQDIIIYRNSRAIKQDESLAHKYIIEEFSDNHWRYVTAFTKERDALNVMGTGIRVLPARVIHDGRVLYRNTLANMDKMTNNYNEYQLEVILPFYYASKWLYYGSFATRQGAVETMSRDEVPARILHKGQTIRTNGKAWAMEGKKTIDEYKAREMEARKLEEARPKSYNYPDRSQSEPKYKIEVCYKGAQWTTDKECYSATEALTELKYYSIPACIIYRGNVIKTNDIAKMVEAKRKKVEEKRKEMKPKSYNYYLNTSKPNSENGLKSPQKKVEEMEKVEKFWIVMALDHKGPVELGQKTYKRYSSKSQAVSDAEKLTTPSQRYGVLELVSVSSVQYVANVKTDRAE